MKNIKRIGSLLLLALLLFECKDPLEDVTISFNTDTFLKTNISIRFVNATEGLAPPAEIDLVISGSDAADLVEASGSSNFEVEKGVVNLAVRPGVEVSLNSPFQIDIVGTAEGYTNGISQVYINTEGAYVVEIPMVALNAPPLGVAAQQVTTETDASGALTSDLDVTIPVGNGMNRETNVFLPAGTVLLDGTNTPVVGQVQVFLLAFDPDNSAFYRSFPGGITGGNMTGENNEPVTPIPSAMSKVLMNGPSGQAVVTFQNGLMRIRNDIPAGTINPQTGSPYAEGDSIGVESMPTTESKWESERKGSAKKKEGGGDGDLSSEFETGHLSYFLTHRGQIPDCETPRSITVNLTNTRAELQNMYSLEVECEVITEVLLSGVDIDLPFTRTNLRFPYDLEKGVYDPLHLTLDNYPQFASAAEGSNTLVIYQNGRELQSFELSGGCASEEVFDVTVPANFFDGLDIVTVDVFGFCPDKPGSVFRPTLALNYKKPEDAAFKYLGSLVQGRGSTTKLTIGETYVFQTVLGGLSRERTVTITSGVIDFEIDISDLPDVCDNLPE